MSAADLALQILSAAALPGLPAPDAEALLRLARPLGHESMLDRDDLVDVAVVLDGVADRAADYGTRHALRELLEAVEEAAGVE